LHSCFNYRHINNHRKLPLAFPEHKHGGKIIQNKSLLSSLLRPGWWLLPIYKSNAKQASVSNFQNLNNQTNHVWAPQLSSFQDWFGFASHGQDFGTPWIAQ